MGKVAARRDGALYDTDRVAWLDRQAQALRAGWIEDLDLAHLAEEVEDMGASQRDAVESTVVVLLLHLLKWACQPDHRSGSWRGSIREHRRRLRRAFRSGTLRVHAATVLAECYADARDQAADETGLPPDTFPAACPWPLALVSDPAFLPD